MQYIYSRGRQPLARVPRLARGGIITGTPACWLNSPAVDPRLLNDWAVDGCNSTIGVYKHIPPPKQNGLLSHLRMAGKSPPGATERRAASVEVPHESRQCVSLGALTQVRPADEPPRSLCWSGNAVCRGALCVHIRYTGRAKRDTKYGVESSRIHEVGAAGRRLQRRCRLK